MQTEAEIEADLSDLIARGLQEARRLQLQDRARRAALAVRAEVDPELRWRALALIVLEGLVEDVDRVEGQLRDQLLTLVIAILLRCR